MTHTSQPPHLRLVAAAPHPLDDLCAALEDWTARSDDGQPSAYLEVGDGVLHHRTYPLTTSGAAELAAKLRAPAGRDPGSRTEPHTAQHGPDPASTRGPGPGGDHDGGHT